MRAVKWIVAGFLIAAISAQGDLLQNGDFEISSSAGHADWWADNDNAGMENYAARGGTNGMAMYGDRLGYGEIYQNYTSGAADWTYTFSVWINKEDTFLADNLYVTLEWLDSSSEVIGGASNDVYSSLGTSWAEYTVVGTAAVNTVTVRAKIESDINSVGSWGVAKFDDAEMTGTIPEPGTFCSILLGLGLVGLRLWRRR